MKVAKGDIYSQANSIPELKFEDQQLTSFAGLVVFQKLFRNCRLKQRMEESCAHLLERHYYSFSTIVQCLIVHIILGYRQLRGCLKSLKPVPPRRTDFQVPGTSHKSADICERFHRDLLAQSLRSPGAVTFRYSRQSRISFLTRGMLILLRRVSDFVILGL